MFKEQTETSPALVKGQTGKELPPRQALKNRPLFFTGGLLTAILTAGVALLITGGTSFTSAFHELYPNQSKVQVVFGLILFGYYLGISIREKQLYAFYFWGFFSGSLALALSLIGLSPSSNPGFILAMVGGVGTGIFFGITRPFLGRKTLDRGIRYAVGGGSWGVQFLSVIGSIMASGNWVAIGITIMSVIIGIIVLLEWGGDIKVAFSFDIEQQDD